MLIKTRACIHENRPCTCVLFPKPTCSTSMMLNSQGKVNQGWMVNLRHLNMVELTEVREIPDHPRLSMSFSFFCPLFLV